MKPMAVAVRRLTSAAMLVALASLGACDSEPSGPGQLRGEVVVPAQGRTPGAAVLLVSGQGIRGITTAGETRAFSARVAQSESFRVLLVSTSDQGPLEFAVEVDDVAGPEPTVTFLDLVDTGNATIGTSGGYEVRFEIR